MDILVKIRKHGLRQAFGDCGSRCCTYATLNLYFKAKKGFHLESLFRL